MFKKIIHWVSRIFQAVGRFVARVFHVGHHQETKEQYQMRKYKEKLAKGETEANRETEDTYLDRMKHHHDLARLEADQGDKRRIRVILSEEATILHDRYQESYRGYVHTFEDEGTDPAYQVWRSTLDHLMDYVHYLDANAPRSSIPVGNEGNGELKVAAV